MKKEIYIIRHGETEYNRKGIIQGSGVNKPLNETGRQQSALFFDRYMDVGFDAIVHTNLIRTQETVSPFIRQNNADVIEMPELREISWGIFEGLPYSPEMKKDYNDMIASWGRGDYAARLEGGESAEELMQRVTKGLNSIFSMEADKILVCSHGRTMRCLMCVIEDLHLKHMETVHHSNTGLYKVIVENDQRKITLRNDISHLERLGGQ